MIVVRDLGLRLGRGSIVNMASMFGLAGSPGELGVTPYCGAKHGKLSCLQWISDGDANTLSGVIGLTKSVSDLCGTFLPMSDLTYYTGRSHICLPWNSHQRHLPRICQYPSSRRSECRRNHGPRDRKDAFEEDGASRRDRGERCIFI